MMTLHRTAAIFASLFALSTSYVRADCYVGSTPTYDDVERVQISDCWPTGPDRPCFFASLEENGGGLMGTYVGAGGSPRLGLFDLAASRDDQTRFKNMLRLLETAQVFERGPAFKRPVNGMVTIVTDGHHFALTLDRCNTTLIVHVPNNEFSTETQAETRWEILQPALEKLVDAFVWKQKLPADRHRDMRAIFTMGASLAGT